jgi:DNA modification methylase/DNA-directed RNA polymerase subunit RPC12/RpoP
MAKGKKAAAGSGDLFIEASGQLRLANKSAEQRASKDSKVECLGMTFESDDARRAYFTEKLREKLKDPEFRKIEGFPLGEDDDILALSDPPYYTACPNPFLADFIKQFGRPYDPAEQYSKEPFASDVSEGRYAPESLAHSYHTKVPARAIARYILHYTKPGDIVLDGFCGTGMTAVAAQLCSGLTPEAKAEIERDVPNAVWGARYPVVADLAPAATFIAANYLHTPEVHDLDARCDRAIDAVRRATEWMFATSVPRQKKDDARVDHTVWSDVFSCSNCGAELVMWNLAVGKDGEIDKSNIRCTECKSELRGSDLTRVLTKSLDPLLGQPVTRPKSVPVEISYSYRGARGGTKKPDDADLALLERIQRSSSPYRVPVLKMLFRDGVWGDMYRSGYHAGTTHFHHFYTLRNLFGIAALRHAVLEPSVLWGASMLLTATAQKLSRMMRYMSDGIGRIQNGVLYFPALFKESNPVHLLDIAKAQVVKLRNEVRLNPREAAITTSSGSDLRGLPDDSVDYIFVDPPFGGNIMYSELNFLWEGWLGVFTNSAPEAIVNKTQQKDFASYAKLMTKCFAEFRRVLKPGRWMTVEFHNSQNSVWNAIQQAIMESGFIIADVRVLDKKQGTFKQVTTAAAVKKDLVISAYKPNAGLEQRFKLEAGTAEGVWDFVRTHLRWLPAFVEKSGRAEVIGERQNYLLFDRMVAFHVQRGVAVPMSASEFYAGLVQRFPERDGMFFLPEQVAEYDRRRLEVKEIEQLALFVSDERTAIQWLRQQLEREPQTYQQIQPKFLRELHQADHEQLPELQEMLQQNFLEDQTRRWYVPDPNKQLDLEKLREKALLREFEEYKASKQKRLKTFRTEAVRAGFKAAWGARDYNTIVSVAQKLPEDVLQEDQTILMYYDNASMRVEA